KANTFTSKLLGDLTAKKKKAAHTQQQIDAHLTKHKLSERTIPYTHNNFRKAAIEWLFTTDQPIQALEHSKFKEMIDVALCARESRFQAKRPHVLKSYMFSRTI
ncbi:hypothetical protein BD769DRAFT_1365460, partial [Suillus cothurnatus]